MSDTYAVGPMNIEVIPEDERTDSGDEYRITDCTSQQVFMVARDDLEEWRAQLTRAVEATDGN